MKELFNLTLNKSLHFRWANICLHWYYPSQVLDDVVLGEGKILHQKFNLSFKMTIFSSSKYDFHPFFIPPVLIYSVIYLGFICCRFYWHAHSHRIVLVIVRHKNKFLNKAAIHTFKKTVYRLEVSL